jgi:diguanylate cyclase (GGDEF)-like protein
MRQLDPNSDTNHRYFIRLGMRGLIIFALIIFIYGDSVGYGVAITLTTLFLYLMSLFLRKRNRQASDLLLTLGDVPALASVVHLPSHVFAFEALIPAWLIGTTVANLRKGQPTLLPLHSSVAWLVLASHAPSTSDPRGYLIVQTLAVVISSLVALAVVLERRVHRTDSLTGLLTRRAGLEELQQLKVREGGTTLAFIDLRHFKAINDQYGHTVGDEVLLVVAKRLSNVLRQSDVLFRFGGDEFIVASQAPDLEARLRKVFTEPVKTKQKVLLVEARIGLQFEGGKIDVDAIVKEADRRMYADTRKVQEQLETNSQGHQHKANFPPFTL